MCTVCFVHLNDCLHFYTIRTQRGCRVLKHVYNFISKPQPIVLLETNILAHTFSCSGLLASGTKGWVRIRISVGTIIFEFCICRKHVTNYPNGPSRFFTSLTGTLVSRTEIGDGIALRCKVFVHSAIKLVLFATLTVSMACPRLIRKHYYAPKHRVYAYLRGLEL